MRNLITAICIILGIALIGFGTMTLLKQIGFKSIHQYNYDQLKRLNLTNDSILFELRKLNKVK